MKKMGYILYQPYKWLIFFPILVIDTLLFGILAVIASWLFGQKTGSYLGGALWSRLNCILTPVFVNVQGRENIQPGASYIIIANHLSTYDIFILYGWIGIDIRWIMKIELKKIPGLGFGSQKVGHIFLDRSSPKKALESIEEAKKKLVNGTSVVIFPEGTRSKDGKAGTYKRGAFKLALDLNLPILPITLIGTNKILPTNSLNIMPGKVKMIIHEPIDISKYNENSINELMEYAYNKINNKDTKKRLPNSNN